MPSGIEITNDANRILITSEQTNFCMVAKGTVTLANGGAVGGTSTTIGPYAYVYYPNTLGYPPPIALTSGEPVVIASTVLVGGDWRFTIVSQNGRPNGSSVEYFIFAPTPNVSPASFGLEVYRADGTLAYHSGNKSMNVVANYPHGGGALTLSLPAGRKYAVMVSYPAYGYTVIPAGTWTTISNLSLYATTSSSMSVQGREWSRTLLGFNPTWGGRQRANGHAVVLDVTGF